MPRIVKRLPENRADYSFGDLVYWHLFKYGTRPSGDPANQAGRVWKLERICTALDITDRTLRNWIFDRHLPDSTVDLSRELFGNNSAWDNARLELQDRLEETRARRGRRAAPRPATTVEQEPRADPTEPPSAQDASQATPRPDPEERKRALDEELGVAPPSEAEHEARPTFYPPVVVPPVRMGGEGGTSPAARHARRAFVAGLAIFAGFFAWVQSTRHGNLPTPPPTKPVAEAAPPKVAVPTEPTPQPVIVPVPVKEQPAPVLEPAPPPKVTDPPPATPPPSPTEEELRAAEQRRLAEALVVARQAAHEREQRRLEEEAIRRDAEARGIHDARTEREADARMAAGLGYRLRENMAVAAASFTKVSTLNVEDCALACEEHGCDAFAYFRDQYPRGSGKRRACYFYRKPYAVSANPGYALGERVAVSPHALTPARTRLVASEAPIRLAQGTSPAPTANPDGLVRCSGGPVKVTGFKLTCDQILGGGTTLGSTQLSYTVANINACAAKCRPVAKCTAFTFNSTDPEGRHACMIFGGKPEGKVSKGWVSGER